MSATRYASALGLGFGDCGKGHFIDALTRRWQAHTVVRFSGGAQAGHTVVTASRPGAPARHHTFSQFGAGTFTPGAHTVLLDPMALHPTALLAEAEALARIGVHDALARLIIDERCRITTPYHQAAGRLRELLRGNAPHGTCGVGVGETVRHALEHAGEVLRYADLAPLGAAHTQVQLERLQTIRQTLLAELEAPAGEGRPGTETELQALRDETLARRWLNIAQSLARQCPPASAETIRARLTQPGCVLFEGAQGVLLDEWRGFHPYTTWSSITTAAVDAVAARFGLIGAVEHYGVLRAYLTRHGVGPFPTHDDSLDERLPEPHNSGDGWQGRFRRGHPDAVLLRYALEAVGDLSGLLVSHLDVFDRGVPLKWCERYQDLERLPLGERGDLSHQMELTRVLEGARPVYAPEVIGSEAGYLERLASVTSLPVVCRSRGNTIDDVA
ncbi:MAG TPA: adenylosuccinate synthetase [Terriglobia bacterium]|nr:adenylosuccinate synthetase [Terriglobia bacterium]